jgi:hypothetical protein
MLLTALLLLLVLLMLLPSCNAPFLGLLLALMSSDELMSCSIPILLLLLELGGTPTPERLLCPLTDLVGRLEMLLLVVVLQELLGVQLLSVTCKASSLVSIDLSQ